MVRHRADRLTSAAQIAVTCPCCRPRAKKIRMSAGVSSPGRTMTSASIVSVRRTGIPSSAQSRLTLRTLLLVFLHDEGGAHHCRYCGNECKEGPNRPRRRAERAKQVQRVGGESDEHQEPLECRQPDEDLPVIAKGACHPLQGAARHVQHRNDGHDEDQETPASGARPECSHAELRRSGRAANGWLVSADG